MSVSDLQARIGKIVAEIDLQKKLLKKLEQGRSLLQRELNAIRDPLARLPLEISSDVFLRCLPLRQEPGGHHIPMLLLNVCKTWTDIALSTPALWTTLHVARRSAEALDKVLETWLRRAGTRPLSVSLPGIIPEGARDIIWQHRQRLKHLDVCYDDGDEDSDTNGDLDLCDLLESTSLRSLPWLESLTIQRSDWNKGWEYPGVDILDLLRQAPNLVECKLDNVECEDGTDTQEHLVLPTLRRLMFLKCRGNLLDCLSIPGLEKLSLSMSDESADDIDILSFLKRLSPPLKELAVDDTYGLDEFTSLHEYLHLLPTLTHLELCLPEASLVAQLFDGLTEKSPGILPNLRSLTLHSSDSSSGGDALWETLLLALLSRRTQIQIIHVDFEKAIPPSENILASFSELVAIGMAIYLGTAEQNFIRAQSSMPLDT
ncbi:hypothetical protein B0H10DRAFT_2229523 [Mycena sp. CBHHK59/15]|nr:hypothetical protein B0H10DRAFT_2229523 [Mycena sp. CBHHK59/15]